MSSVYFTSPFDRYEEDLRSEGRPWLAKQLLNVGGFLHGLRFQMRYGELTRAPLRLLCLQINGDQVKCDWVARPPDPWDADLARDIQDRHSSLQTLKDAIDVRGLLFDTLPFVETAHFQVFREASKQEPELIVTGCGQRNDHSSRNVHSIALRAKVLGFRFSLEGDILLKIGT